MAEIPRRIEIPAGSPLGQILRDGITTAGEIREGDLIVYANPPAAPSVGESPRWTNAAGRCKACDGDGGVCEICTPGSNHAKTAALKKGIASLMASRKKWKLRCAALRSSLEEARKDSERLDWLMTHDELEAAWTRPEIDENLQERKSTRAP